MRLRGVLLYAAVTLPFVALVGLLLVFGATSDNAVAVALIVAAICSALAAFSVRARYLATTEPRSVFYGMLVSALEVKVALAIWIAYVIAANRLALLGFELPVPPQPYRTAISIVLTFLALASPIYYAVTIGLEGRAAHREEDEIRDIANGREL